MASGQFDLILSVGQVVPHEVIGMANYNKNIFVGTGGQEGINRSHFLGAAWGMERIMGRADNPVRRVLNYAATHFAKHLPIVYAHTVVQRTVDGRLATRGLFIGEGRRVLYARRGFEPRRQYRQARSPAVQGGRLPGSTRVSQYVARQQEHLSDAYGHRRRGRLIVLGPGVGTFGEDATIDTLIRRYGYVHKDRVLELVKQHEDLAANLSAAAHLIHGSPEGASASPTALGTYRDRRSRASGFAHGDLASMTKRYDPSRLADGYNTMPDGEEIFYIPNPALGLWAHRSRF